MGTSKEREGLIGKYTEHFDDDGNKIGESKEREGFFGKYIENTDADGNKTGESRYREGVFGEYTEHTDSSGQQVGESLYRKGGFEPYTEHIDSEEGTKLANPENARVFLENILSTQGNFIPNTNQIILSPNNWKTQTLGKGGG